VHYNLEDENVTANVLIDESKKLIYITRASGDKTANGDTLQDYNTVSEMVIADLTYLFLKGFGTDGNFIVGIYTLAFSTTCL